jgi:CheY-like chemotaxis protein
MILIIENNSEMRRLIRSFVADSGAEICECDDAAESFRLCAENPEWILFNLEIKETDGIGTIRQIKRHWRAAKIVAVTSYDEAELRAAARAAGAVAYVLKEDLSELRRLVGVQPVAS